MAEAALMTEAEWNACADPRAMLEHLGKDASERKLRLFAIACCRRVWHLLPDERSRKGVEVSEDIVEGNRAGISHEQFEAIKKQVTQAKWHYHREPIENFAATAVEAALQTPDASRLSWFDVSLLELAAKYSALALEGEQIRAEGSESKKLHNWASRAHGTRKPTRRALRVGAGIAALARDIFGNPFHPARLDSSWLAWNDGAIPKMAQAIYNDRAFDRLPLLADALEEAGCSDAPILGHCRDGGEHVRGCWVLGLLLGNE